MSLVIPTQFQRKSFVVALSLCLGTGLAACGKKPEAAADTAKPVMTVEVVEPRIAAWNETVSANGNVAAWQEAVVGAEVGGTRLLDVRVNVGDIVKKGDELARLDPATLQAELAQREAEVAQAEASLAKAQADADRAEKLDQTGSISQQEIHQYRTAAATEAAQLKLAKAQLEVAQLNLRYARVVAPDDGVISSRTATVGTVVSAGTELFRLIRGQRLEWRAEVPADQMGRIKAGMPASIQRADGSSVAGTVRQIAPTVDLSTRNGIVYVDLPRGSGFAAGQFVKGNFSVGEAQAQSLPESAMILRDGHTYVMTVDDKNIVHQLKVETGRRSGDAIEVVDALPAGVRVVRSGGAFIGDGDLISVGDGNTGTAGNSGPSSGSVGAQ
jgi:RND family efflux transporter MFP subunit